MRWLLITLLSCLVTLSTLSFAFQGNENRNDITEPESAIVLTMPDRPDKASLSLKDVRESRKIIGLHFSADGSRLVASTNWGFVLWDVTTTKILYQSPMNAMSVSATDANLLLSVVTRGKSNALDMRTGAVKKEAFAFLEKRLVAHEKMRVLAPDASLVAVIAMPHPAFATGQMDRQGKDIGLQPDKVVVANARTGAVKFTLNPQLQPEKPNERPDTRKNAPKTWTIAFSNDSKLLAACTSDGCVTVWDMSDGKEVQVFRFDNGRDGYELYDGQGRISWIGPHDCLIVPGKYGFMRCDLSTKEATLLSAQTEPVAQPKIGKKQGKKGKTEKASADINRSSKGAGPNDMSVYAFTRDGRWLIETSRSNPDQILKQQALFAYDGTGKQRGIVPGIKGNRAWTIQFSPDGQLLAIGTTQGIVLVYKVVDWEELVRQGKPLEAATLDNATKTDEAATQRAVRELKKLGADIGGLTSIDFKPMRPANFGSGPEVTDTALVHLKVFKNLQNLKLHRTSITDMGLKELKGLSSLENLYLENTKITDTGLQELSGLTKLKHLRLSDTKVTSAGLKSLKGLKNLRDLYLDGTQVTDTGLKELVQALPALSSISLNRTRVSETVVKQLKAIRPQLVVLHNPK